MTRSALAILVALGFNAALSNTARGHYSPGDEPLEVKASLAATWRSDDLVGQNDYWQIPGTLMGGHAWPYEKGITLDTASLAVGARIDDHTYAVLEAGSHGGGDNHGNNLELQQAYLGYACCAQDSVGIIEAGRMGAAFSPSLATHSAERLASESPLIGDVFFGRDFHDEGIRFQWQKNDRWTIGAELWRGKAFPANTDGDGAWDLFARKHWQSGGLSAELGGWYYQASPSARADHRYGGGHSHTPIAPPGQSADAFPDTRYTGDVDIYGLHGNLNYQWSDDWSVGIRGEWMQLAMNGVVHDEVGRQAELDAEQIGGWLQPYLSWRKHTLGIRAELLSTDNHLTGPAASVLADDSGLANPGGFDPKRYTAIWRYQWRKALAIRAELIQDDTLPVSDIRWNLGVTWQGRLWPSNHH